MPELENKKHERFCREFVIDHIGARAARDAGYSEKTADAQASRLLTYVKIKERIKELEADIFGKLGITHEKILKAYSDLAFTPSSDLFFYVEEKVLIQEKIENLETGEITPAKYETITKPYLKPYSQLTKEQLSTIQEIRETRSGIAIKQYSRKEALDTLSEISGLRSNKLELTGPDGGPVQMIRIMVVDPKNKKD